MATQLSLGLAICTKAVEDVLTFWILFNMSSVLQGKDVSGDISGLIGQYAHGNEPGHHTIYMYNKVGAPHKTQRYVHKVLNTLYDNTPEGICGNEDTGQMSAWYVFSSLGFYPMNPVSGQYELGTPSFEKAVIHLPSDKDFTIRAEGLSDEKAVIHLPSGKDFTIRAEGLSDEKAVIHIPSDKDFTIRAKGLSDEKAMIHIPSDKDFTIRDKGLLDEKAVIHLPSGKDFTIRSKGLFDEKAVIHLPSEKDFTIRAKGLSESNYCLVKNVYLNGKRLERRYITFKEVLDGGELVFEMTK